MGGRKKIRIIPRILMNVRRYENTKKIPKQCRCQMYKAKISGTQVGENTMNRKLSRVCTTYYDVICVKQKSAPNIQDKDKEVKLLGA